MAAIYRHPRQKEPRWEPLGDRFWLFYGSNHNFLEGPFINFGNIQ